MVQCFVWVGPELVASGEVTPAGLLSALEVLGRGGWHDLNELVEYRKPGQLMIEFWDAELDDLRWLAPPAREVTSDRDLRQDVRRVR